MRSPSSFVAPLPPAHRRRTSPGLFVPACAIALTLATGAVVAVQAKQAAAGISDKQMKSLAANAGPVRKAPASQR